MSTSSDAMADDETGNMALALRLGRVEGRLEEMGWKLEDIGEDVKKVVLATAVRDGADEANDAHEKRGHVAKNVWATLLQGVIAGGLGFAASVWTMHKGG